MNPCLLFALVLIRGRYEFQTERGYKWGGVGYLAFFWIFSNILSIIALCYRDRAAHGKGHAHADQEQGIAPTLRPSLQEHLKAKQHRDDHAAPMVRDQCVFAAYAYGTTVSSGYLWGRSAVERHLPPVHPFVHRLSSDLMACQPLAVIISFREGVRCCCTVVVDRCDMGCLDFVQTTPHGHVVVPVGAKALPFSPVSLLFQDIAYSVPTKEGPKVWTAEPPVHGPCPRTCCMAFCTATILVACLSICWSTSLLRFAPCCPSLGWPGVAGQGVRILPARHHDCPHGLKRYAPMPPACTHLRAALVGLEAYVNAHSHHPVCTCA
jgi:hypothetical protein